MVDVKKTKKIIPTYVPKKPNELPMFFENKPYQGASGRLYPLPFSDGLSDEKTDVEYDVFELENEYIKLEMLPYAGGKLLSGYDKLRDYDFIYRNRVIKPALVGIAGAWISGGIEFNWPQHHRPTTFIPTDACIEKNKDGSSTVWMGEIEPFNRMKGMVGITVDPGRNYIKAKVKVYNRTALPQVFMWWSNLAVPVNNKYRTIFPPDVEWVNDHDRRAVLSWPIAKGLYKTARPYNYGEGTDLSRYESVILPSSFLISQDQSDMNFIAGYDEGLQKGIATVANHFISPGKKMWTWGHGEFGEMWCNNLTDEDGPYIELMTGVYTDNQPDFTWIAPYESREFEQYWYPVFDIGYVKNASIDAAMNMEQRGNDLFFGFNVTGTFNNARIMVKDKDEVIYEETTNLDPKKAYLKTIDLGAHIYENITVSLYSENNKLLVEYKEYKRGQKKPIEVRKPVARPCEIDTVEELYINGLHLEQYKQHNYNPKDYYLEGLKRDPGDIRCNTGMARISLKNGEFEKCVEYCNKAIERLTSRNEHPYDTESMYLKGIALEYIEEYEEAYKTLYKAAWNYSHRGAALYELAKIDVRNKEYNEAIKKLDEAYGLNKGHMECQCLKATILRHLNKKEEARSVVEDIISCDNLMLLARFEKYLLTGELDINNETLFTYRPEDYCIVSKFYMDAGLYEDARKVLEKATESPIVRYYKGYVNHRCGFDYKEEYILASSLDTGICFPSALEDIAVLKHAIKTMEKDANACYYLGSLFYDRFRYDEAISMWEEAINRDNKHAKSYRNLAFAYFDKKNDGEKARIAMEKALEYRKDPRILFEYQQLLEQLNVSPIDRLHIYEDYKDLLAQRDDCYLDKITLLAKNKEYKKAIDQAAVKHFHIYEGGEGKLTKLHAWIHVLYANELVRNGDNKSAEEYYLRGINMPKSYGEAKTFFNQEGHINYFLGKLLESEGRTLEANNAYEKATEYKAAVTELSLFRALAMYKLGNKTKAEEVLNEMINVGNNLIKNADLRTYYGVGSPSPMPFDLNVVKSNTVQGNILLAYAYLGLGKLEEAEKAYENAYSLDPYNFALIAYNEIKRDI